MEGAVTAVLGTSTPPVFILFAARGIATSFGKMISGVTDEKVQLGSGDN